MSSLENFALEYWRGVEDTVEEIKDIVDSSEYPEDLELAIYEWLKEKGVNYVS